MKQSQRFVQRDCFVALLLAMTKMEFCKGLDSIVSYGIGNAPVPFWCGGVTFSHELDPRADAVLLGAEPCGEYAPGGGLPPPREREASDDEEHAGTDKRVEEEP